MQQNWLQSFVETFVPLFIAVDPLGNVPIVVALGEGMMVSEQRRMVHVATITATIVGLAFLFFGRFVLGLMGISVGSFAIAGGIILLVLSIRLIITGHIVEAVKEEMVAVVPIGTPLVVGPATITTLLLLSGQYNLYIVLISFILNMLLSWVVLLMGDYVVKFMGQGGLKAVSKVFSLLLGAIAVGMVIRGLDMLGIIKVAARGLLGINGGG